jgi:hypothetical protein
MKYEFCHVQRRFKQFSGLQGTEETVAVWMCGTRFLFIIINENRERKTQCICCIYKPWWALDPRMIDKLRAYFTRGLRPWYISPVLNPTLVVLVWLTVEVICFLE